MDQLNSRSEVLKKVFFDSALNQNGYDSGYDGYTVRLPNFEGPLDLLLHLIRRDQLNLYDIPIAQICESYLEHLELIRQLDVNIAGEFMVMASTLLHLKSQMLLPKDSVEENEPDPRMPLVEQLLEYERFKRASQEIEKRAWLYRDIFHRPQAAVSDLLPQETLLEAPMESVENFQLLVCLKIALDRTSRKPLEIVKEGISLRDAVRAMALLFSGKDTLDFSSLVPVLHSHSDIIVNYLAILELARLKFLEIFQSQNFGPILIKNVRSIEELDMALLDQF